MVINVNTRTSLPGGSSCWAAASFESGQPSRVCFYSEMIPLSALACESLLTQAPTSLRLAEFPQPNSSQKTRPQHEWGVWLCSHLYAPRCTGQIIPHSWEASYIMQYLQMYWGYWVTLTIRRDLYWYKVFLCKWPAHILFIKVSLISPRG